MIDVNAFLATLPIMLKGMAGIFIVIGIIVLCVMLLTKLFPEKKNED